MNILALDLGTSSVRGLVLDGDAVPRPGALARRKMTMSVGEDGAATLDGPGYLAALVECLDELAAGGHLDGVGLVAASAQWHSVVALGPDGAPRSPVLTWLDTRPAPLPGASGPADETAFHQRTGTWWHRFYWNMRLPWLRDRLGGGPVRYVGLAEYVFGALLHEAPMSVSQASATGMLDVRTLRWDDEACALAGVRDGELPVLAPAGWRGRLRPDVARRWPALADASWAPPIGDGAASNIGSQCVDENRAAVTVGTSAAVRLVQASPPGVALPPLPDELWRYRMDHERIVTGTAFSGGGNLYAWARRELRLPEGKELEQALARLPHGATPVRADPRLGGDRPPGLASAGSGQLSHLGFNTTAVEIFASLMEALCHQVARGLVKMESTVGHPVEVVLGGGAVAASQWWREAFLTVLAPRPVSYESNPEIGATGAALVAIGRLGGATGLQRVGPIDRPGSPTPAGSDG
ncbi:FGGY family carbohydrate kinase [Micromonospora zhanjiangensis]|uniref:FGGY family carbohydrate kinase n=1 Tax=Micromonospora zhanjiangensis TaxID=1522057 RepID=A0ABV8KK68_9ACTN